MPAFYRRAKIFRGVERQPIGVPLSDVLTASGKLDILPSVVSKGYFDIDYRNGQLTLVAGKYIGLIPINDRVLIEVRPKAEMGDLLHILEIAEEDLGYLHFFERSYKDKSGSESTIIQIIVRSLLRQLRAVAQEGLHKTYSLTHLHGTFKPRINFPRTMQKNWCRGAFSQTSSDVFEFTKDNPLNRLVKYTLWYCGRYSTVAKASEDIRSELEYFYNLFATVPLDTSLGFLPEAKSMVTLKKIPQLRQYYSELAKTCFLIAEHRSISLESEGNSVSLLSFILNLEDIFEKYVRNVVKKFCSTAGSDFRILDGNTELRARLFHDARSFDIKPDIAFRIGACTPLVVDVKYKPKVSESDRYQIITHALSLGSSRAILVLPGYGDGLRGLVRRGQIKDASGIEVYEYHLNLESQLPEQEADLGNSLLSLAQSSLPIVEARQ